jgi:endonuclease III
MRGKVLFMPGRANNLQRSRSVQRTSVGRQKRATPKEKSARAGAIAQHLAELYPDVECPLAHRNTFELLVAVILSAQCTDAAVNKVTPALFCRFPDPISLSRATTAEIEALIRSLGLYRAKAKSLQCCARQLVEEFSGEVPATMKQLIQLSGVGRKTANVILGHAFDTPGIAVDTHCKRLARRLGLTRQREPTKIEQDLSRMLPPSEWTGFSHRLIIHGRRVCYARRPACERCVLSELCPSSTAGGAKKAPI